MRREGVESQETASGFKARTGAQNIQEWKEKPFYGQFARQGENQRREETWTWPESLRERRRLSSLLHKIKQYVQIMLKQRLTSPRLIPSVEFASRAMRPSATLQAHARNWPNKNIKGDVIMWLGRLIGIVRKMLGLSEMSVRSKEIPVVVGALGSVPLRLKDNPKVIDVGTSVELIQKCALLGSARILRKVSVM